MAMFPRRPSETTTPGGNRAKARNNEMSIFKSVSQPADSIHNVILGMVSKAGNSAVTIAPGIAKRLLEECNFNGQRKIRPNRVMLHRRRIRTGAWNPDVSVITLAKTPDGKLHNVNGQHRLAAIEAEMIASATRIIVIEVKDIGEVRRLYASFDEPGSSRTDAEMLDGIGAASSLGMKRDTARFMFRALSLLRNDLEPMGPADQSLDARDRDGRLADMAEWRDETLIYEAIVATADKATQRSLWTQGVMASALYTLRHQPKMAREFWGGLAANDGLRRNDPRACLLADFRNRSTNTGSIRQRVQRVSVAWNAYAEGRDLRIIKCVDGAVIRFAGTPKGGR